MFWGIAGISYFFKLFCNILLMNLAVFLLVDILSCFQFINKAAMNILHVFS